jgi:DEAD/DEAH box helicase|nr:MAG TPA: Chromatin remodeling complex ATPase [Caudoviricetes sp.]
MPELKLRDYQEECVDTLFKYWEKAKRPCVLSLSTGAGKSVVVSEIIKRANTSVLILQPSKEILEQNYEKLLKTGFPQERVSICSASAGGWSINSHVTFATIGTIAKWVEHCQHIQLVIIDECDCVTSDRADSQYMKFLNALPADCRIVGLTATPFRNVVFAKRFEDPKIFCRPITRIHCRDGEKTRLGAWVWNKIIYRCNIDYLQERGFLSKTQYHVAETDWSFVRDVPGRMDFDTTNMMKWVDIEENTSRFTQAVKWCMDNNLKTIIFSPNVDMNYRLQRVIEKLGGVAECMDSDNDTKSSREIKMQMFREGRFQFLVNVGMVGRGVDVPSVDCVVLCRPTKSLALYMQFIGRALRVDPDNPDKLAYILDLAGNVDRFGHVEDIKIVPVESTTDHGYKYTKDVIVYKPGKTTKILDKIS